MSVTSPAFIDVRSFDAVIERLRTSRMVLIQNQTQPRA